MDRRSWLWRRKSSDKSSGETESFGSGSASGSLSSPSERFSDEQQAYPNQNTQSPEITSKAAPHDEDANDSVKILSEKLSAAFAIIKEKEESVKQHAKVAEEAVTGWERAENEVNTVKLQLDAAAKKNTTLEDRIVHLDGALKECLRQLRQVKEEQNQRTHEATANNSEDTDNSSGLEGQLADLHAQLQDANAKAEAAASTESDLRLKLTSIEKKNVSLRIELQSRLEELEVRTLERDLSTKTAEAASKQHLESIKKVAKLEVECRKLKAMARKTTSFSDQRAVIASPSHVSSSQELDHLKLDKTSSTGLIPSSHDIGLMDDFLEMEKLAALPARETRSSSNGSVTSTNKHNETGCDDTSLRTELEAMINRTAKLEEKMEMIETENVELGLALSQCQDKLKLSEGSLAKLQGQFNECQNHLKMSQAQLRDANKKLGMLQAELDLAGELRQAIDLELDDANVRREEAEAQRNAIENESKILLSKISFLEGQAERERTLNAEASAKSRALEDEVVRMKHEEDTLRNQLSFMKDSKEEAEQELRSRDIKKETAETQLKFIQAEVKSLLAKIGSLENDAEKERHLSLEFAAKCGKLENEISRMKNEAEICQTELTSANDSKKVLTQELQMTNAKKEEVEVELKVLQAEVKSLHTRVSSLEHDLENETTLSSKFADKCRKLEDELLKMKSDSGFQLAPLSKEELNKQQEKELAVAASKLAECQKTIASLGNQLKSLATLEDLFLDSDNQPELSEKELQLLENGVDSLSLSSSNRITIQSDLLSSETGLNTIVISKENDQDKLMKDPKEQLSTLTTYMSRKNGLGKLFSRGSSTIRSLNL